MVVFGKIVFCFGIDMKIFCYPNVYNFINTKNGAPVLNLLNSIVNYKTQSKNYKLSIKVFKDNTKNATIVSIRNSCNKNRIELEVSYKSRCVPCKYFSTMTPMESLESLIPYEYESMSSYNYFISKKTFIEDWRATKLIEFLLKDNEYSQKTVKKLDVYNCPPTALVELDQCDIDICRIGGYICDLLIQDNNVYASIENKYVYHLLKTDIRSKDIKVSDYFITAAKNVKLCISETIATNTILNTKQEKLFVKGKPLIMCNAAYSIESNAYSTFFNTK